MPETFVPKTWVDGSGGGTPITAAELNRIENGVESMDDRVAALEANPTPAVVTLTDGATVNVDASAGKVHWLTAAGDRTIAAPTNAVAGRGVIIKHTASGGARTLSLTTGSAGSFRFGSDITALSQTVSGKTDVIGCLYDSAADRWDVVSYVKGF